MARKAETARRARAWRVFRSAKLGERKFDSCCSCENQFGATTVATATSLPPSFSRLSPPIPLVECDLDPP